MGIIKWNHSSFSFLTILLFLSGDIQPNPGPDTSGLELCSICNEAVLDDHKAVCCDLCDSWVHVSCDPSLSDDLYANMVQEPSTDPWFCTICSKLAPVTVTDNHHAAQLSCACLNARSVLPKRFDIFAFICAFHIDILAVTETFLDGTISDGEICPGHYQLFCRDCSRHGGGVLIMIRENIKAFLRNDLNCFCDELLFLEVSTTCGPVLFGVFYRPPSQGITEVSALSNCLLSVSKLPVVLCGDFNLPNIDWSIVFPTASSPVSREFCDLVRDNCLSQLVSAPTRHHHLLDLLFTNRPDLISKVCVVDNLPSTDHEAIHFMLNVIVPPQSPCKRILYNYKKADMSVFLETLSHVPWHLIENATDIEESWQLFKDLLFSVVDMTIPRLKWRKWKLKHWFSYETIHLIRQKRHLYLRIKSSLPSPSLLHKYRSLSNIVRGMTRRDTQTYTERICQGFSKNPRKFWAWVNTSKGRRTPIPSITVDGSQIIDDTAKANNFNHYFYSVFTQEDMSSFDSLTKSLEFAPSLLSTVKFLPQEVLAQLNSLDVSKACGPDLITGFLLKQGAKVLASPLSYLFTMSMCTAVLPRDWVTANVVPVFKREDKSMVKNYRPISLTSLVVKTMERIIYSNLLSALESHGRISSCQYGFRKSCSASHLLVQVVHDWAKALDSRNSSHCLFLDFAKAFDSVPHQRLLLKLQCLGIRGDLLNWFRSYLTNRSQRVVINGHYSGWLPVLSGVPQGSILGPLLFILYINDLHSLIKSSSLKLYADDVALYATVSSYQDCVNLQDDLARIYDWSLIWQLKLSPSKCEALNITNKHSPVSFTYTIGSISVAWCSKVKYLGVVITSNLKWNDHCQRIVQKATQSLNRIRRAMYGCTEKAKTLAYLALVRPCLEYCSVVWTLYTSKNVDLIESVQRRAARWIRSSFDPLTLQWTKSSNECIRELGWPSLELRRHYACIVMIYAILNNFTPINFYEYYRLNKLSTRSHSLTIYPIPSSINAYRYSFFVNSIFFWNSISFDILSAPRTLFKYKLKQFLFDYN